MLIFSVSLLCTSAAAQFETRSSSPIIYEPQSVAVADFNHDGKLDVAVADFDGEVAILFGRGDGTFQPPTYYPVSYMGSIAAAGFNHDGNIDLVMADGLSNAVTVMLGNGDGTFQPPQSFPTTAFPTFVAVGDFNNDGNPDLVVCDEPYVSVLLSNGDGTFRSPQDYDISFCSQASGAVLAVGDFNRDGKLDLAVVSYDLTILLGNGDGTFTLGPEYFAGIFDNSLTVADFNGDHKLDIAVTNGIGYQIYIFLGNGDGTFQSEAPFDANAPSAITAADLNGDGKPDLIFVYGSSPPGSLVTVMLGNGDGTFQPALNFPYGRETWFVTVGDFNGDRKLDIVTADYGSNAVGALLNTGVVSFSPTTPLSFTPQLVGTSSAPQNLTLRNTGTVALSVASISTKPPFHLSTTCQSSVPPGGDCTLSVTFEPSVIGFKSGVVSLNDSASSKPQAIELNGIGTVISYSPTKLSFGSLKVGTKSAPQVVTVTNTGSTTVTVTKIKIADVIPPDYFQTNNCGSQIAPGASCTINVTFKPTRTGPRTATLEIFDSGGASPQQVPLTGTGT
jgi:archaellum component FlaF (FlaF/FlaG flagellin family)